MVDAEHSEEKPGFEEFRRKYAIVAGIALAKARKKPDVKKAWLEAMQSVTLEGGEAYLEALWKTVSDSINDGKHDETSGKQPAECDQIKHEQVTDRVVCHRPIIDLHGATSARSQPEVDEITKNNLHGNRPTYREHKHSFSRRPLTVIQRIVLLFGMLAFTEITLNPPFSHAIYQSGRIKPIKFIGRYFYTHSHSEYEIAIDLTRLFLLQSVVIVVTLCLMAILSPRDKRPQ